MAVIIDGTAGIANNATDLSYTGTLTGGTGVVNLGSGQVYKDASGNVGIGTSSPSVKLEVAGTQRITNATQTNSAILQVISDATGSNGVTLESTYYGSGGFGPIKFTTGGSERARIDSSGNLLVGTTSTFDNVSFLKVQALGGVSTKIAGTGLTSQMSFFNDNGRVGYIGTNGTTTSYNTSSDYRLKEAIAPMTGALAKVALLKPCTYTWKEEFGGTNGQGFIAHELQAVVPECVSGAKDAVDAEGNPQYQGIDTSFLIATLSAAIQELKAIVDAQATRITALEGAAA